MFVLLADQNRDILLTYQNLFALRGDHTVCVFDGTQALTALTENRFDLLIINQQLPRVFSKQIITYAKEQHIPSIELIDTHISSAVLLGDVPAAAFLALPFSPEILFGYADAIVKKATGTERFSIGKITVDVANFCFADSDIPLTSKEIDLLRTLAETGVITEGKHLSTYINALDNKLLALQAPFHIEYISQKGYCMVDNNE